MEGREDRPKGGGRGEERKEVGKEVKEVISRTGKKGGQGRKKN